MAPDPPSIIAIDGTAASVLGAGWLIARRRSRH